MLIYIKRKFNGKVNSLLGWISFRRYKGKCIRAFL